MADADLIFGDALSIALDAYGGFEVCGSQPTSGLEAIEEIVAQEPEIALLDFWLREMEGPASVVAISSLAPNTRVMLLAWFHGPRELRFAVASGAAGFLPKSIGLDGLVSSIGAAVAGETPVIPASLLKLLANPTPADLEVAQVWQRIHSLTPRELQTLVLLARELPVPMIGRILHISPATVRRHLHHILRKTQTNSSFEAAAFARHYGIVAS